VAWVRTFAEVLRGIADVYSLVLAEVVICFVDTALLMYVFITIFAKVRFVINTVQNCRLVLIANFTHLIFMRLHNSVDRDFTLDTVEKLDFVRVINGVSVLVNSFLHLVFVIQVH